MVYLRFFALSFQNFFCSDKKGDPTPYHTRDNLFLEDDILCKEPISLFNKWYKEARECANIVEANAGCLATSTRHGIPSNRMMLIKEFDKDGLKFFTSYNSRKGQELKENPKGCLVIYWEALGRSIRVEGDIQVLPAEISDEFWNKRLYDRQIIGTVSDQDQPVESRKVMEDKARDLKCRYGGGTISRPSHWGGYILKPKVIEFWQGQTDRLHDRIRFRIPCKSEKIDKVLVKPGSGDWVYERLWP